MNSDEVTIVLNIDMGKQGLDVFGRANFMLRLQTPSLRSPCETSNTSCIVHGTCSQANYIHGLPEYVDQFTIAISHNMDVTRLKHHQAKARQKNHRLSQLVIDHDGKR